jgi:hypothetical protein
VLCHPVRQMPVRHRRCPHGIGRIPIAAIPVSWTWCPIRKSIRSPGRLATVRRVPRPVDLPGILPSTCSTVRKSLRPHSLRLPVPLRRRSALLRPLRLRALRRTCWSRLTLALHPAETTPRATARTTTRPGPGSTRQESQQRYTRGHSRAVDRSGFALSCHRTYRSHPLSCLARKPCPDKRSQTF